MLYMSCTVCKRLNQLCQCLIFLCLCDQLSPRTDFGNLKEYVLSRRCQKDDIITFLCQVAAGLHYLHVNHIVHGDLRAEHVHVVEARKVRWILM